MPSHASEIAALSTVTLLAVFVSAWLPARTSARAWGEAQAADGNVTTILARDVAWVVIKVLLAMWMWLALIILSLVVLQKYLVNMLRKQEHGRGTKPYLQVSRYGSLMSISFGAVAKKSVALSLLASLALTYLIAWVSMRRAIAGHPRATPAKRSAAIMTVIDMAMTFNLVIVVVSLSVAGIFLA